MEGFADEELVVQAKAGDLDAFTELARRYQQKIYYTVYGLTRNHLDADDITQETFMSAYKSLARFKQHSSFYTWIYRIAVNLTLNFLKKKTREKGRKEFMEQRFVQEESLSPSTPEAISLKKELGTKIDEAIDSLPAAYRSALALVVFQGMTHSQAARILRCSENTVSWRMHKARKMLQDRLRPFLKEVGDEV